MNSVFWVLVSLLDFSVSYSQQLKYNILVFVMLDAGLICLFEALFFYTASKATLFSLDIPPIYNPRKHFSC